MFTVAEAVLLFPATSIAPPVAICAAPSFVKVTGEAQLATPDKVSEQVKLTVTLELFQPNEFAAGTRPEVITGGVLSMLRTTEAVVVLPALSSAVPEIF